MSNRDIGQVYAQRDVDLHADIGEFLPFSLLGGHTARAES